MELSNIKELGIAMLSVLTIGFLLKYVIDKNKEVFDSLIEQLQQNRTDYTNFVQANNHDNTDRIEKSTEALVKVATAIGEHTKVITDHTKVLEKMIDKLQ